MLLNTDKDEGLSITEADAPELSQPVFAGVPFGKISLEYAEKCLRSCLYLCRKLLSTLPSVNPAAEAAAGNPLQMSKDDIDTVRQAALANLAFVSLATSNPKITIACAKNLLLSKTEGQSYRYPSFSLLLYFPVFPFAYFVYFQLICSCLCC